MQEAPRAHRHAGRHASTELSQTGARWMPPFRLPSKCSTCSQMAAPPRHFHGRRGKGGCRGVPTFRGGLFSANSRGKGARAEFFMPSARGGQPPCGPLHKPPAVSRGKPAAESSHFQERPVCSPGKSHARLRFRSGPDARATRTVPVDLGKTHSSRVLRARCVRNLNCSS